DDSQPTRPRTPTGRAPQPTPAEHVLGPSAGPHLAPHSPRPTSDPRGRRPTARLPVGDGGRGALRRAGADPAPNGNVPERQARNGEPESSHRPIGRLAGIPDPAWPRGT